MSAIPRPMPGWVIHGIMVLGILCAAGFRCLPVVQRLDPALVRPIWYFSVLGYIVFFGYRAWVSERRKRLVLRHDLVAKTRTGRLDDNDRELVAFILTSLRRSREDINYFVIFALSILAVVLDLLLPR